MQFKAVMAMPPDPAIAGESWRDGVNASTRRPRSWNSGSPMTERMPYWQRGSVSTDYRRISGPVYIVDGWVSTYVNTWRACSPTCRVPLKASFGPWAHNYPGNRQPRTQLEWAYEEVRWWKQWLAGARHGILDVRTCLRELPREAHPAAVPGRMVAETSGPFRRKPSGARGISIAAG